MIWNTIQWRYYLTMLRFLRKFVTKLTFIMAKICHIIFGSIWESQTMQFHKTNCLAKFNIIINQSQRYTSKEKTKHWPKGRGGQQFWSAWPKDTFIDYFPKSGIGFDWIGLDVYLWAQETKYDANTQKIRIPKLLCKAAVVASVYK